MKINVNKIRATLSKLRSNDKLVKRLALTTDTIDDIDDALAKYVDGVSTDKSVNESFIKVKDLLGIIKQDDTTGQGTIFDDFLDFVLNICDVVVGALEKTWEVITEPVKTAVNNAFELVLNIIFGILGFIWFSLVPEDGYYPVSSIIESFIENNLQFNAVRDSDIIFLIIFFPLGIIALLLELIDQLISAVSFVALVAPIKLIEGIINRVYQLAIRPIMNLIEGPSEEQMGENGTMLETVTNALDVVTDHVDSMMDEQ